jgi:hypothetical protein
MTQGPADGHYVHDLEGMPVAQAAQGISESSRLLLFSRRRKEVGR